MAEKESNKKTSKVLTGIFVAAGLIIIWNVLIFLFRYVLIDFFGRPGVDAVYSSHTMYWLMLGPMLPLIAIFGYLFSKKLMSADEKASTVNVLTGFIIGFVIWLIVDMGLDKLNVNLNRDINHPINGIAGTLLMVIIAAFTNRIYVIRYFKKRHAV